MYVWKTFKSKSIRDVIATTTMMVVLVTSLLIGGISLTFFYFHVKESRMTEMGLIASQRHQELGFLLKRFSRRIAAELAQINQECHQSRLSQTTARDCLQKKLNRIVKTENAVGVSYRSPAGLFLAGRTPDLPDQQVVFTKGQIAFVPPMHSYNERIFYLKASNEESRSALWVAYPASLLQPIFGHVDQLGESGETFLADPQGMFITAARYDSTQGVSHPISAQPMQHCLAGSNHKMMGPDYRDVEVIHGFEYVPEVGGGCIMSHFDTVEAFTPFYHLMGSLLGFMALLFVGAVFISRFLSRSITRPLRDLERSIEAFINGELKKVSLWGISEIDSLISEFAQISQQALEANQDKQQVFKALSEAAGVVVTDGAGRIIDVNQKFMMASGLSREDVLGTEVQNLYSDGYSGSFFKGIWSTVSAGTTWSGEIKKKKKGSSPRWTYTVITPIRNLSGEIIRILHIEFDTTNEKLMQEQLNFTSKLISLGEMSAMIAHEINNPLSIIAGTTRHLQESMDNPETHSKLTRILRSADRITKIVRSLRKFARREEEHEHHPAAVRDIIQESLVLMEAKAKSQGARVDLDCRSEGRIACDETEIEQVLINLIGNGLDATEDLDEKWVHVALFEDKNSVVLQIRDSGKGIPQEIKQTLFEPFHTTKAAGKGTGLGLSIVKRIVENHHATIGVLENDPNTCFEIRFPKAS